MEPVMDIEVAEAEVSKWLDLLEVSPDTRSNEFISAVIKKITELVSKGLWIFNDDETVTVKILKPLGDGKTTEINYSNRYTIGDWHTRIKNIAADDNTGRVLAKLSMMSKLPLDVFKKLDNKDYANHSNVAVFF